MRVLLPSLLLLTSGCAPILFPWPPPSMNVASLDAIPEGHVEIAGAASALATLDEGVALGPNVFGGPVTGSVGVGLPRDIDVTLVVGRHAFGTTLGATGVWWPVRSPTLDLGVAVGLAGSEAAAPGDEVDGASETTPYATLAPNVGARLVWTPTPAVSVPLGLRASHTWTIADGMRDTPRAYWFEGMTGAIVHFTPNVELGVGVGVVGPAGRDGALIFPVASVSLAGSFDARARDDR